MTEIYIVHRDWRGICIKDKDKISRKDYSETESGKYIIERNKLIISWEKWNNEIFFYFDNPNYYYLDTIFYTLFDNYFFFEKNKILNVILNKNNDRFTLFNLYNNNKNIDNNFTLKHGTYKNENDNIFLDIDNNIKIYKNIGNKIYCCLINSIDSSYLFTLDIIDNFVNNKYIFNKNLKRFFSIKDINNYGTYEILDNSIIMNWNTGYSKKFYTNIYKSNYKSDITIIKPKKIIIGNKILFSNISLCDKKVILTSIHYRYDNWNINDIIINIKNLNIINKLVLDNNDYESSSSIILELEKIVDNLSIEIIYNNIKYDFFLEQLKIKDHTISAMTLFKDDYILLKRYLKYYSNLGVEIFFLYYNKKINSQLIEDLIKINENNVKIYLVEWIYDYWWYYSDMKHHHAQTMAINDSLNILKNYGKYILYNDLDEYFLLDKYADFNEMITENTNVDIFVFKNRFCKMGDKLIKYQDFDQLFDLNNIIEGNFWDTGREKNLIKLENINIMGIHKVFTKFSNLKIIDKYISQFYHIINFEEKYREELMTQYIT